MTKSNPLSIRTEEENKGRFTRLAGDEKAGSFLVKLMDVYEAHSTGGEDLEVSSELKQARGAMNLVLKLLSGVQANSQFVEQNIRSVLGQKIESLELEKAQAISRAREAIDHSKELEKKLELSEGMVTAFKTVKEDAERKRIDLDEAKLQLGDLTKQLKDLPKKEAEINKQAIRIAKLETENEQLRERMLDYKTLNGFGRDLIDGVQIEN